MSSFEVDLLFKYPLITPANVTKSEYNGYVTVNVSLSTIPV